MDKECEAEFKKIREEIKNLKKEIANLKGENDEKEDIADLLEASDVD